MYVRIRAKGYIDASCLAQFPVMQTRAGLAATIVLALAVAACGAGRAAPEAPERPVSPREAMIADLQNFQEDLGVARTGNFQRFDGSRPAVYRCYYTGLLELPPSYTELRLLSPDEPACPLDAAEFDIFFYASEAVASGDSPVSPALVEAPVERTLVVVPHEDFHNQPETERASFEMAEGAATLVGFLTARDYARTRYGDDSDTFRRLDREVARYLAKARLVNDAYAMLARVYATYADGALARDAALARKAEHFAALGAACGAAERAVSFNPCPAAFNNAGLAFDYTYTRFYPAWLDLHTALGADTAATVAAFKTVLAAAPRTEDELRAASRAYLAGAPE
jgi:hypothetical protein